MRVYAHTCESEKGVITNITFKVSLKTLDTVVENVFIIADNSGPLQRSRLLSRSSRSSMSRECYFVTQGGSFRPGQLVSTAKILT